MICLGYYDYLFLFYIRKNYNLHEGGWKKTYKKWTFLKKAMEDKNIEPFSEKCIEGDEKKHGSIYFITSEMNCFYLGNWSATRYTN